MLRKYEIALVFRRPPKNDNEIAKMINYPYHELCRMFPPCSPEELEGLRESIEKQGLLEPIVLLDGKILDGRNRASACMMLGIEPTTVEFDGDNPVAFVLAKNLNRRHLNESQRAMIASKISTLPPYLHKPKNDDMQICMSKPEAAVALNVSERQVRQASKLRREAETEVIEQVERGEKTVHAALKEAKPVTSNAEYLRSCILTSVRTSFKMLDELKRDAPHEYFWQCLTAMDTLHDELFDKMRKGEAT
jgi:hypothetical protein